MVHDVSVYVRQAENTALMTVCHSFVVDPQLMRNRRVQIMDGVLDNVVVTEPMRK